LLKKIKIIKQLEEILDIELPNIDTNIDVDRFDEEIEIVGNLKNKIKSLFRSNRIIEEDNFKNWYYQLIQMYKNVINNFIFDRKKIRYGDCLYWAYTVSQNISQKIIS
jgi:hypothetical protein